MALGELKTENINASLLEIALERDLLVGKLNKKVTCNILETIRIGLLIIAGNCLNIVLRQRLFSICQILSAKKLSPRQSPNLHFGTHLRGSELQTIHQQT